MKLGEELLKPMEKSELYKGAYIDDLADRMKPVMLHKQGKYAEAEVEYLKLLSQNFDDVQVLAMLGTLYLQTGKVVLAAQFLIRAVTLDNQFFDVWNNLGNCFKAFNKDKDAEVCWKAALEIKGRPEKNYADIYNNLGTLYVNAGCPEKGMPFMEEAIKINPEHPDANWNHALMLLEQGKYKEGFEKYHWGFKTKARVHRDYGKLIPYWNGEKDRTVVVWGEQGIGDEIMFASMLPELCRDSKQVIFECHPRLIKIFQDSFKFDNLVIYPTRKDAWIEWTVNHPDIDYRLAIADLGKFYRKSIDDFPKHEGYLKGNSERMNFYKKKLGKLGNRLNVGISWTGGYVKTRKDYRSIPLEKWKTILDLDCNFISLQYTKDAYETLADIEDKTGVRIYHWPSAVQNNDYAETAALVGALDLVITINTTVHHLAGAMGKPCWTLTPVAKAWRYYSPDKITNVWYPSVRQFEQDKLFEWDEVINNAVQKLKELL